MGALLGRWTPDVRDVAVVARFWAAALGYRIDADCRRLRPFCVLRGRGPDG